ncbi:hypothetical protein INT45_003928 [Circinella minor]|uniref:Uncharacterized protein n=1 Tax=Circinella minor TaxID=1195481 RepID=A0A8H7VHG3_9FUNG|nr:hypothetical protein INT45_003928 [Circinella minor]
MSATYPSNRMRKLPQMVIKTKKSIGECELFTMYFDPFLSALLLDSDKSVLLRWSNITADETGEMRPDGTITKLWQRDFGPSLAFGEVNWHIRLLTTTHYVTISCVSVFLPRIAPNT